jgi:uncharacterized protein (DUF2336 family)
MMKLPAYPHLDGLVDLACRDGVDIRPTLLRVLTDLYVQKPSHSSDEEVQYVELALGLIGGVDAATRAAVASTLERYPAAPAAIVERLGNIGPPAARYAADQVTERFFTANSEQRRMIIFDLDAGEAPARVAAPPAGELMRRLENAALQRNTGEFGRVLARVLDVSSELAQRITRDYSGEPLVIAAKTMGMPPATLHRILLFLNPAIGQSVERVHALADLFEELPQQNAARMIEMWRGSAQHRAKIPVQHEAVQFDDERRSARSFATSTVRRKVSRSDEPPRCSSGEH